MEYDHLLLLILRQDCSSFPSFNSSMSKLVLFCATFLSDTDRLLKLNKMIQSVMTQTHETPLWLSACCETIQAETLQRNSNITTGRVRLYTHTRRLAQFHQFMLMTEELVKELRQANPLDELTSTYVAFVDDDDTIQSRRMATFNILIQVMNLNPKSDTVMLPLCRIQQPSEYEQGEFWEYCVRLDVLLYFVRHTQLEMLKWKCCDRAFVNFLIPPVSLDTLDIYNRYHFRGVVGSESKQNLYLYSHPLNENEKTNLHASVDDQEEVDTLSKVVHNVLLWCYKNSVDNSKYTGAELMTLFLENSALVETVRYVREHRLQVSRHPLLRASLSPPMLCQCVPELKR